MMSKREYVAALAEAKRLSEIDRNDLTKEQISRRSQLYDSIAQYEKGNRR